MSAARTPRIKYETWDLKG